MPFNQKTVFILGAGSSAAFPLGLELIRNIISDDSIFTSMGLDLLREAGITQVDYRGFISQLRYADPNSIDAFLEENPDLVEIGKFAIAYQLLKREDELDLFPPKSEMNNWYKKLADALGIDKNGKPSQNELKIFTYNYERSLEHYLTRVIQHRMRIDENEAREIREKVPIYHLHGSLGSLSPQEQNFRAYTSDTSWGSLKVAAGSLRIISEQSDDYSCGDQLRTAFSEAEKIFFLGFGYHNVNMRRLMSAGLREKLEKKGEAKIIPLRYQIHDIFWKKILKNQFESLLQDTGELSYGYGISDYLIAYGFENND